MNDSDSDSGQATPSKEQLMELARQVGQYSQAVRSGSLPLQEAIDILVKPPFNYPNRRHAWRVLDPGPPTP